MNDTERECLAIINEENGIYFYNSLRVNYTVKSTYNLNKSCNFDGIITHKNKYLGTCEFKPYHISYEKLKQFPLQLCKIHLAKLGVPFFLLVKCKCGTILYYKFKKSHLKKFEICETFGYKYLDINKGYVDSNEMFFHIPKDCFKVLKKDETIFLQKFYIDDIDHKQIIEDSIMKNIPRIINL
jgi:hypothetical protein